MNIIHYPFKKPLYGTYCYLRVEVLDKAIREGAQISIDLPSGSALIDPIKWKANGKIMQKVFKYPDKPMILYGGNVPLPPKKGKVEDPKVEVKQNSLFQ